MGGAASHLEVRGHLVLGDSVWNSGRGAGEPCGGQSQRRAEVRVGVCSTSPTFLALGVLGETCSSTGQGWYHQGRDAEWSSTGAGQEGDPAYAWRGPPWDPRVRVTGDSSSPSVPVETPDSVPGTREPGWAGRACGRVPVGPGSVSRALGLSQASETDGLLRKASFKV